MGIIQPGQATLRECVVNGIPFFDPTIEKNYFHVQELRIYEDHCKAYFTGQLVIEAHQNTWEGYLAVGGNVSITFDAPRSDGGPTKSYTEQFVILSYESKPRPGDINSAMVITLSLIGQEYFNDKYNSVSQAFANIPGTAAAAAIHGAYMQVFGGLQIPIQALGMIGLDQVPHEVNNKKPIKAIHDILDKSVFAAYPSCAPCYFRNKPGYVIAPLQYLLENGPLTQSFTHQPSQAAFLGLTAVGYNRINHLRPMAPPSEHGGSGGGTPASIDGALKSLSSFDLKSGNFAQSAAGLGSGRIFSVIDQLHQSLSTIKNGPGNWQKTEDEFLKQLYYKPKYWVSVPLQTGVNVTCGDRIKVTYPFSDKGMVSKTLYVPRLIHELRFTEGNDRSPVTINGLTDIFGVDW